MPTILVFDDDAVDAALIARIAKDGDHTVLASQDISEFQLQMTRQPIDLVIISLATVHEQDTARLQSILRQVPDTKVFTIAPAQRGAGLTTLLRAESLGARHLLAKPLDPDQLRAIFDLTFPQPAQQD
jgi:DNA-binding NtrC family response regulator